MATIDVQNIMASSMLLIILAALAAALVSYHTRQLSAQMQAWNKEIAKASYTLAKANEAYMRTSSRLLEAEAKMTAILVCVTKPENVNSPVAQEIRKILETR